MTTFFRSKYSVTSVTSKKNSVMSSKASYDPVGKARPQTADAEAGNDEAGSGNGASGKAGSKAEGFTVRVRRMERRNWLILAGAGVLVALVVIVVVVLVTNNTEDPGVKVQQRKSQLPAHITLYSR